VLSASSGFKTALQSPIKQVSGYLVLPDGSEVTSNGDLIKYTVDYSGEFLKTAMGHLTASLIGEYDLTNQMVDVYYGVLINDETEYILKGKFTITDSAFKKDENITEIEGYDNMLQFQQEYTVVSEFPATLFEFLEAVCSGAGVVLDNESIYNGSLEIPEDYYADISDTTYRDVLREICEVSGTNGRILPNGHLRLEQSQETSEVLTYSNLLRYKLGEKYGGINSLVLSRQPQNDDVFFQDTADIQTPTNRNILDLTKFDVTYSADEESI
jgi:hypothetical protein